MAGEQVAIEEQDFVYRSDTEDSEPSCVRQPAADATEPTGCWRRRIAIRCSGRFSTLTYNGHRIHYDYPYATAVEGYLGLVVRGPLLALERPRCWVAHSVVTDPGAPARRTR